MFCDQVLKPACSAPKIASLEILSIASTDSVQKANNKDADQTARMHKTCFLMSWLNAVFQLKTHVLKIYYHSYFSEETLNICRVINFTAFLYTEIYKIQ